MGIGSRCGFSTKNLSVIGRKKDVLNENLLTDHRQPLTDNDKKEDDKKNTNSKSR